MEIMRYDDIEEYIGVGKRTVQKWVAAGEFPQPIRMSVKKPVWDKQDIVDWLYGKKEVQKNEVAE